MDEIIKLLDPNLDYISHEIKDDFIYIMVESNKREINCPYCGNPSAKVHSRYRRKFQDKPIQGKKVVIILDNRKMFCQNPECSNKTFAESYSFLPRKSQRSQRLEQEILDISLHCSSIAASKILSNGVVDIGKSAICRLLKKQRSED